MCSCIKEKIFVKLNIILEFWCKNIHVKHVNSQKMKLKYNSGTQYVPLDHIETVRYHITILFTIYHCCASMLYFGDFHLGKETSKEIQ